MPRAGATSAVQLASALSVSDAAASRADLGHEALGRRAQLGDGVAERRHGANALERVVRVGGLFEQGFAAHQTGGDDAAQGLLDAAAGDDQGSGAELVPIILRFARLSIPVARRAGRDADLFRGLFERQAADVRGAQLHALFGGVGH
jgi:hypothetical protein